MCCSVALKELFLAITEFLSKRLELFILENCLIRCQLQKIFISIAVVKGGEVGVVEDKELLGPRLTARCVWGVSSISALLDHGAISELCRGLLSCS